MATIQEEIDRINLAKKNLRDTYNQYLPKLKVQWAFEIADTMSISDYHTVFAYLLEQLNKKINPTT